MDRDEFRSLISELTAQIAQQSLDSALAERLNREHAPGSQTYERIFAACRAAIADGWMCEREAGGIRYGRVIKPGPETHDFSVDVVDMSDCAGPHHIHPKGEIDLVMPMPIESQAAFDGQGAGWKVYGPGSAHFPTVRGGRALVLYLLPNGEIQFTGKNPEKKE
jgi:Domain of unknown function (DUF4863)